MTRPFLNALSRPEPKQTIRTVIRPLGILYAFFILAVILLTGCQYVEKMKVDVDFYHVGIDITNHNDFAWEECKATLNTEEDKASQYALQLDTVQAGESVTVLTTNFTKPDGKRFIPVVTVAKDIDLSCKKPLRGYHQYF